MRRAASEGIKGCCFRRRFPSFIADVSWNAFFCTSWICVEDGACGVEYRLIAHRSERTSRNLLRHAV